MSDTIWRESAGTEQWKARALHAEAALGEIRGWAEAKCIHDPDTADVEIRRIVREFFAAVSAGFRSTRNEP